jgi:tRNA pseudouridine55 synthase
MPDRPRAAYAGILNLDKPRGVTSHDAVSFVRRQAGMRRVGHAGTLDPEATGVLLVCLGPATRLSDELMQHPKRYRATVRFGGVSTTDDAAGIITPNDSWSSLTEGQIAAALPSFLGDLDQVPPSYAAIKVAGRPLYRHARAGQPIQAAPRRVHVQRLDVLGWRPPDLLLEVTCSKGTYIRAIARDLGRAVGTGGYLLNLVRTASGSFDIADSLSFDDVGRAARLGYLDRLLYPLEAAVAHWPAILLDAPQVAELRQGRPWFAPVPVVGVAPDQCARAYAADSGTLIALLRRDPATGGWRPEKVLAGSGATPTAHSEEDGPDELRPDDLR